MPESRGQERGGGGRRGDRDSPLGPWRPSKTSNPFGERSRRQAPRDPFAKSETGAGDDRERKTRQSSRRRPDRPPLDLRLEIAPEGVVAHLPQLPGCTFRAGDPVQLLRVAPERVIEYLRWCMNEGLGDLNWTISELVRLVDEGKSRLIEVAEVERRDGAAIWLTGQPAALFRCDYRGITDSEVRESLRFARAVVRRIRMRVASLTPEQRAWKPAADRRSLDETLEHLCAMTWWFCSRLDDDLPEPLPSTEEDLALRLAARLDEAEIILLGISYEDRQTVHLPGRQPGADPEERWTHAKACRRLVEHLWEHLAGIPRAVRAAAEA